jgi:hypothetical protein
MYGAHSVVRNFINGVSMLKKTSLFLLVITMLMSLLAACGGSATTDKDAQDLLKKLNDKATLLIHQPGWVHVTEKVVYDTDKPDRGTLANGTIVPLNQTIDIWYHTNAEKLVYEYVWMMSNPSGDRIEVTVFLHNTLFNLTTNLSNPLNPYSLKLDYQFSDELDYFLTTSGNHVAVANTTVNGKDATVFTLNQTLASQKTSEDFNQAINAIGTIASFDTATGLLLKLERTVTLADGSQRTFYTDNITVETNAQPTQEVQDYVNGFW